MMHAPRLIRTVSVLPLLLAFGIGCMAPAAAEPEPQKPGEPPDAVVRWLDKLEKRGNEIQSLQARLLYEKNNELLGDRQFRTGTILYHDAQPGPQRQPRFTVRFEQLIVNGARREQRVDYVFDGTWLVEKNHQSNLFLKRQVVPPGQTLDPLQIDGPFPVPIGQQREEVLRRFNVGIVEPPEGTDALPQKPEQPPLHLRLTPRADAPQAEGRKRFQKIDMWFNRETLLPMMVRTLDDQQVRTTVKLSNVRVNQIEDEQLAERFDTTPPEQGWRVEITPWQNAQNQ